MGLLKSTRMSCLCFTLAVLLVSFWQNANALPASRSLATVGVNCQTTNTDKTCKTCLQGHALAAGTCKASNCKTYAADGSACTVCNTGFTVSRGVCSAATTTTAKPSTTTVKLTTTTKRASTSAPRAAVTSTKRAASTVKPAVTTAKAGATTTKRTTARPPSTTARSPATTKQTTVTTKKPTVTTKKPTVTNKKPTVTTKKPTVTTGRVVSSTKPAATLATSTTAKRASTTTTKRVSTTAAAAANTAGLAVLGSGTHSVDSVEWTVVGTERDGLNVPRDLEFGTDGRLWVVNRADDSTVTYTGVGTPGQTADKRIDPYAKHFMEEVSSLAFGAETSKYGQTFGTCQESTNTYNNAQRGNNFMGPTLWPSATDVYAKSNPAAVKDVGFNLGSHLDMLHQSPLCMGIEWDHSNVYWTFDGASGSISRYDFQKDHTPGYDDHSDGIIARYVPGQVSRVADVPSHLALDRTTKKLYIADTGNARIAVLDTASGVRGKDIDGMEQGVQFYAMDNATLTTLVDTKTGELQKPSGLVLVGDVLYVTDNGNGRISAFNKTTGKRLDYLDTKLPVGALMGITADAEGRLYFVHAVGNAVVRIAPQKK